MREFILIVDDEPDILSTLKDVLEDEGYRTIGVTTGEEALSFIERELPDIVILDVWLEGIDGIEVLGQIKEKHPDIPVLIISGHGTIETAIKAVKLGAYDFIEKPIDLDRLLLRIEKALEESKLRREYQLLKQQQRKELIGESTQMKELLKQIHLVAPTDCWVLIYGESGTGKELVAKMIHELSPRKDGPFVVINCAVLPEENIEIELFGCEPGVSPCASARKGKFELANNGTLYFDEVGDMSLKTQAKVLRVLEELKIERLGGTHTIDLDIRVIASTNKDLEEEVRKGNFRHELFYRLNVFPLRVPPLRERKEDIPLLAYHFLKEFSNKYRKEVKHISPAAMKLLTSYHWPGNVRELKNLIERLVISVQKDTIEEKDIPYPFYSTDTPLTTARNLKEAKAAFEREYILRVLKKNEWNISKAAEELGIERSHLYKKLRAYGIRREEEEE